MRRHNGSLNNLQLGRGGSRVIGGNVAISADGDELLVAGNDYVSSVLHKTTNLRLTVGRISLVIITNRIPCIFGKY